MSNIKRVTVYFDPELHKALKLKAAEQDESISNIVNKAVGLSLAEDAIDLEATKKVTIVKAGHRKEVYR